jgi:hypothetical protein
LIYNYEDEGEQIVILNGKFTNGYGIESIITSAGDILQVSNKARTLVEVTVRPLYAGGVANVIKIFKKAKGSVLASELLTTLKEFDYIYPYHQSLGFYMERAGYSNDDLSVIKSIGANVDFYLDYELEEDKEFNEDWRVFHPARV